MARTGSGTSWDDPYIVDNWADLLTVNNNSNYVKFANPSRTITGDGSAANPFVVSTYEEMLAKTGATHIWQVKLIEREAKKYKYSSNDGDIFLIYDDSITTIDFNNEPTMPSSGYTTPVLINCHVDFNGWTLKNIAINYGGQLRFANTGTKNIRLQNLLILRWLSSSALYLDYGIDTAIINMQASNDTTNALSLFYAPQSESESIRNSSITIKSIANSGTITMNCMITDSNVLIEHTGLISLGNTDFTRTRMSGTIDAPSTFTIADDIYGMIFDVYCPNGQPSKQNYVYSSSFWNTDKCNNPSSMTATNLYGATTEQLKNPQWLYEHGLLIGVDSR